MERQVDQLIQILEPEDRERAILLPVWQNYDSLEDYRDSLAYHIATTISTTQNSDYDKYLELLTERGIGWGEREKSEDETRSLSRGEILRETAIQTP